MDIPLITETILSKLEIPGLFSSSYLIILSLSVVALNIFFLISSTLSNIPITPWGFSSDLLIFLVGSFKSFILVPFLVIKGSGKINVSPYLELNLSAIFLASSTCCFWSIPTGT